MAALPLRYDAARAAIAECKSYDEVRDWADKAAALAEYARRAGDRSMELDCAEIRVRAARRQGELLGEMRAEGKLRDGRTVTGEVPFLEKVGMSKNESSALQKIAGISVDEFEARIAKSRAEMAADKKRHTINVLREGPVNGARAIAPSRQEPADSLDYFPTPPWATRALIEHCITPLRSHRNRLVPLSEQSAWEPACGEGHMAEVLREYFGDVLATDIYDYGYGDEWDFLDGKPLVNKAGTPGEADWIITNPPFGDRTEAFVLRALDLARAGAEALLDRGGVAMFVRLQWLESIGRYEAIFRDLPPTQICFFAERVNLCKGRWDPDGTTATAYIWLVWIKGAAPRPPLWIPPGQREALTRPDDKDRFTAHPVIAREHNEPPWCGGSEPAPVAATHPLIGESDPVVTQDCRAGSPYSIDPNDPLLRIPEFCRRAVT